MSKAPAFQLYAQDFLVGSAEMLPEEVGAYIRLLCYQWTKGGIPDDVRKIQQLTGLYDVNSIRTVLTKFSKSDDGMLRNNRLEQVRKNQKDYSERQRQIAVNGWEKRRAEKQGSQSQNKANPMPTHKKNEGLAVPRDMPEQSQNDALHLHTSSSTTSTSTTPPSEKVVEEKTKRFVPPTVTEVAAYCNERGNAVDAQRFIDHYTSNGWHVGKTKMKDWKAAVRTWEKNNYNTAINGTTKNSGRRNIDDRLADAETRGSAFDRQPGFDDIRNRNDDEQGYAHVVN